MLDVFGPHENSRGNNYLRSLGAMNDGGRWVFDDAGEPFPFEKPKQYKARRVRDRFTLEMLKDLLQHLGLEPFREDFYVPPGSCAWLAESKGFPSEDRTLEEAREDF